MGMNVEALLTRDKRIRAEERERCAKIAERLDDSRGVGKMIADAIRALEKNKG